MDCMVLNLYDSPEQLFEFRLDPRLTFWSPRQMSSGICLEELGGCAPRPLRGTHELNSWLNEADHIESGQTVLLPSAVVAGPSIAQTEAQ